MLKFDIKDRSLVFFHKGRAWDVAADHPEFQTIRSRLLLGWGGEEVDLDALVALADVRIPIIEAAGGKLEFVGNQLLYGGRALHNVWVDKILRFKNAGEPFAPLFNALEDLMHNPTPEAIERLPNFVEHNGCMFLPDGRIVAYKGVRSDYRDCHSGTLDYTPGKAVVMDRSAVDADPNRTCSAGLHVGALQYVREYYGSGAQRIVTVAVWPRDFVAVPVDYNGSKARVCKLDVLEDLGDEFTREYLDRGRSVYTGYTSSSDPEPQIGDWVELTSEAGIYQVVEVDGAMFKVQGRDMWYDASDEIDEIVTDPPIWRIVKEGDRVRIEGDDTLRDGVYVIDEIDDDTQIEPDQSRATVDTMAGSILVRNDAIKEIIVEGLRAKVGDKVRIEGSPFVSDGVYPVVQIDAVDDTIKQVRIQTEHYGTWWVGNDHVKGVASKPRVGDKIRVEGSSFIPNGTWEVARVRPSTPGETMHIAVKHPDGYDRWIEDDHVKGVV